MAALRTFSEFIKYYDDNFGVHPTAEVIWNAATESAEEKFNSARSPTNKQIMPCERHSCCNCGNTLCPLYGVNCSKFKVRTA
ncbi:MAG: hypothetical protein PHS93_10005 [Candidatus Omnitrophica bacterium]|nr:hypothetical protein [Candidatus Omnitrophota bacterium]MDD5353483.1 hypothetical protein [Candidatus Omnitrophota bacterium]